MDLPARVQSNKTRRYIIGDPSFTSYTGHCFEYLLSLATPLRTRGDEVVLAGNRGMSEEAHKATGAYGVFTYWCDARPTTYGVNPHSRLGRLLVRRAHERSVQCDLEELTARIGIGGSDTLILNTFRHWGIRGIVRWAESLPKGAAPRIALILHFTARPVPGRAPDDSDMYRDAFGRIAASSVGDRFQLLTDSQALIDEYRELTSLPVRLAPIPHSRQPLAQTEETGTPPGRAIRFTYAGEARINKGFHLLPHSVHQLEAQAARPFEFEIQTFVDNPNERFYQIAIAKLRRLPSCRFVNAQLDGSQYDAFIRRSDVILIPYLIDNYHAQTSGIYAEAVSVGKPVIAPMGTWMADQVRKYGGGALFPPGDQHGFSEAILRVLVDYEMYFEQAQSAARSWAAFHTADRLIELIDKPEVTA